MPREREPEQMFLGLMVRPRMAVDSHIGAIVAMCHALPRQQLPRQLSGRDNAALRYFERKRCKLRSSDGIYRQMAE